MQDMSINSELSVEVVVLLDYPQEMLYEELPRKKIASVGNYRLEKSRVFPILRVWTDLLVGAVCCR